ncbi:DNA repair protein RecO [Pseudomaricurvus alkylphenolicus]|jgi:DNA repair protein RecO (recombination protein O)|uniref:DNA repair protein RecO n=1 Tax=Pseudomaricurvus alkylphenolicus TaxID=1306991 RepID=UPI00142201ED|nr:DNA repair protein RecO [Pseudomaricurvus alkylphenolicus]NIB43306.1 DNA repair protein RecO [Pseudomaricurvus alkylphenolicus]
MRVELQQGFVLHRRPFKDSSLILDCLTENHGRLSVIAKGARSAKSRWRQMCQPFCPLLLSWQGRHSLKTLVSAESTGLPVMLSENYLYSGLYLNELLTRLLPEHDACERLYGHYVVALEQLGRQLPLESTLRQFELALLEEMGYAVDLEWEAGAGARIEPDCYYQWRAENGFERLSDAQARLERSAYLGGHLLAIGRRDLSSPEVLRAAKRLSRQLLGPLLGHKPLESRKLFAKTQ